MNWNIVVICFVNFWTSLWKEIFRSGRIYNGILRFGGLEKEGNIPPEGRIFLHCFWVSKMGKVIFWSGVRKENIFVEKNYIPISFLSIPFFCLRSWMTKTNQVYRAYWSRVYILKNRKTWIKTTSILEVLLENPDWSSDNRSELDYPVPVSNP